MFVSAMRDLQKDLKGLSKKQKDKIFGEGKKFMSLEVIYPKTANVIPYDKSLLQFHGTIEYDSDLVLLLVRTEVVTRMLNWYDKTDKPKHTEDV